MMLAGKRTVDSGSEKKEWGELLFECGEDGGVKERGRSKKKRVKERVCWWR